MKSTEVSARVRGDSAAQRAAAARVRRSAACVRVKVRRVVDGLSS